MVVSPLFKMGGYQLPFQGLGLLALFGCLVVGASLISFRVCIFHNKKACLLNFWLNLWLNNDSN